MAPAVSVIIPSYNSAAYLSDAIDSVLNQTVAPLEVIVVDDGSTDETAQILERHRGRIVAITQENRGLSGARNRGIAAARGELIAFLDADDIWLPGKLEKQVACLAEHPTAGMVHSELFWWDEQTGERHRRDCRRHEFAGSCYKEFFLRAGIIPSTAIVRRECLEKVGDFDEAIRRPTTQDYDLSLRIARDYEIAYVDEPLILYRLHESNASKQLLAMEEDILFVVRKALRDDPGLWRSVGGEEVSERLFTLLFEIGYRYHDAGRRAQARRHFLQALRHRPFSGHTWLLYLGDFLPSTWARGLRQVKSSAAAAVRKKSLRAE